MPKGKPMPKTKPQTSKTTTLILAGIALLALLITYLPGWFGGTNDLPAGAAATDFAVHFIDVGQGDSTLIQANGKYMLIDGGERGSETTVVKYLNNLGVEHLDIVVATHPHSDHIGGLAYGILDAFSVGTVIAPQFSKEYTPTTQTYEQFLRAVAKLKKNGTTASFARPGTEHALGEAACTILGPLKEDGEEYNNDSVIMRVQYGNFAVLVTGDAERGVEKQLVDKWGKGLQAALLKAGHHGSKTSSSQTFLNAVKPQAVVISCGADNSYGHPHEDVLQRCRDMGIQVFRTDTLGAVVFGSDGKDFWRIEN